MHFLCLEPRQTDKSVLKFSKNLVLKFHFLLLGRLLKCLLKVAVRKSRNISYYTTTHIFMLTVFSSLDTRYDLFIHATFRSMVLSRRRVPDSNSKIFADLSTDVSVTIGTDCMGAMGAIAPATKKSWGRCPQVAPTGILL